MIISINDWNNYIEKLSKLSSKAGELMRLYIEKNGIEDINALINYAHALVVKYGEGSATLSAMMYDAIAELEGVNVPPAVVADVATIGETAKAVRGVLKQSPTGQLLESAISRMVKQAGADTTLKNSLRDGAEFAWIPAGDTCAFCISLASRGWTKASKKAIKGGHAEHIHANCDCQYAIRFDKNSNVKGYDPEKYRAEYDSASDGNSHAKINAMRRKNYAENKDVINAQKREAYAIRTGEETL